MLTQALTGVHGFEEKSKFLVPGYMDLKKNKIYIPEYMDLKKKQNSMYWVHESEKRFLCIAQGGGERTGANFFLGFGQRGNQYRRILKWNLYVVHRTFIFQIVKNKLTLNCYNIRRGHVIQHYYISICT